MLVLTGQPVELEAHIGRLSTSVEALYGCALPPDAEAAVLARARGIEHGKLRITVLPAPGALAFSIEAEEVDSGAVFPAPERGAALRSLVVAGGLGEHKWADRRLLDQAAAAAPGELALLLDADGAVLEGSRASVFVIRDGRLATPPADGRILPSIARQQAIEVAAEAGIETSEERLTTADMHDREVFLTGSVRGVEPARSLDGEDLAPPSPISRQIAAGLRRRWRVPATEPAAAVAAAPPAGQPGH
jgi:para-aminobenzoate synthetase / 4-amino-4-deoxychorismate lyase